MKALFILLLLLQGGTTTTIDPISTETPPNAFTGFVTVIVTLLYAVAGILGLLSAARIYTNYNVGEESIMKGATNLLLGMVLLVVGIEFIRLLI